MILKQNAAFVRPFYVGVTGLTIGVSLSKNGGTFAGSAGTVAEISNGWYKLSYTSGDTDTEGALAWAVSGTGVPATLAMPVDQVNPAVTINAVAIL